MPALIPRVCRKRGCPETTTERSGYCQSHRHTGLQQHQRGQSWQARGYGRLWQSLRARILARDKFLCQPCLRQDRVCAAHAVDHIRAKAFGGTDEEHNLEAICFPCHRVKTPDTYTGAQTRKMGPPNAQAFFKAGKVLGRCLMFPDTSKDYW